MSHGRSQHPNAGLTPGRRRMVGCAPEKGWTVETSGCSSSIGSSSERTASMMDFSASSNTWPCRFLTEYDTPIRLDPAIGALWWTAVSQRLG